MFRPPNDQECPNLGQKSKNLKFELEEMWDYQFVVKFHVESDGDSLDALKRRFDPKMAHKGLIGAKI